MNELEASEKYMDQLLGPAGKEPIDPGIDAVEIHLPPWYDAERFRRGQKFYWDHHASTYGAMFMGLISILAIPSIIKVLICTGKSGTAVDAYRRYIKTIYHIIAWNSYELHPGSKAWQSIKAVRQIHLNARKFCEGAHKITINQFGMVVTQFAFMAYTVLRPKIIGIHLRSDAEMEDTIYFWRVLGYLMGIRDELNICTDSYKETYNRLQRILENIIRPGLENPHPDFGKMAQALAKAMSHYNCHVEYEVVLYLVKRATQCKGYEYFENEFNFDPIEKDSAQKEYYRLSWRRKIKVHVYVLIFEYAMQLRFVRLFFNTLARYSKHLNYYFPITAIFTFGYKKSYVRIFR